MPRPRASVPPEAIRIEDEVWDEAFTRREPAPKRAHRLHAIEGGRPSGRRGVTGPPPEPSGPASHQPARHGAPTSRQAAPHGAPTSRPAAPHAAPAARQPAPGGAPAVRQPTQRPASAPRTAAARRPLEPLESPVPASSLPARRTVTIRGHGAERNLPWPESSRRRPPRLPHERAGFRPDRVAMWAVMLGILLVIVAIASS